MGQMFRIGFGQGTIAPSAWGVGAVSEQSDSIGRPGLRAAVAAAAAAIGSYSAVAEAKRPRARLGRQVLADRLACNRIAHSDNVAA